MIAQDGYCSVCSIVGKEFRGHVVLSCGGDRHAGVLRWQCQGVGTAHQLSAHQAALGGSSRHCMCGIPLPSASPSVQ